MQPEGHIEQQLEDLNKFCSQPQKELLNIYHVLSDRYNGLLLTNGPSVSGLRDGNYEFSPYYLLVDRCNSKCKHVEGITCKATEENNAQSEFYSKDQEDKYHKLIVNEHTKCHCTEAA